MSELVEFKLNNNTIACVVVNGNPWFKGKYIATLLGYVDTKQAVAKNVSDDDRMKMEELMGVQDTTIGYRDRTSIYINESGLYCLIFGSKKREALLFKKWVTSEVLPLSRNTAYMRRQLRHYKESRTQRARESCTTR